MSDWKFYFKKQKSEYPTTLCLAITSLRRIRVETVGVCIWQSPSLDFDFFESDPFSMREFLFKVRSLLPEAKETRLELLRAMSSRILIILERNSFWDHQYYKTIFAVIDGLCEMLSEWTYLCLLLRIRILSSWWYKFTKANPFSA